MRACFRKQRTGEVSVDDHSWVETFHLVRTMNNLHRRLEYVVPETGAIPTVIDGLNGRQCLEALVGKTKHAVSTIYGSR